MRDYHLCYPAILTNTLVPQPGLSSILQNQLGVALDALTHVYLVKSKDEDLNFFKIYKAEIENQLDQKIKRLRSDHGGEYFSSEFDFFVRNMV